MEEAGTVRSPCEVIEVCGLTCGLAASLDGRPATESSVNTSLVVIGGEPIQLAMEVDAVPEEGLIEILAPNGSDKALYKWVRARHEGDGLDFLDVENAQIRAPAMKSEQRVMIGTEALGKWLTTAGLVEHAADTDAVDMRRFNTESDDTTREDIHHDHYPEALQQDRLAAK